MRLALMIGFGIGAGSLFASLALGDTSALLLGLVVLAATLAIAVGYARLTATPVAQTTALIPRLRARRQPVTLRKSEWLMVGPLAVIGLLLLLLSIASGLGHALGVLTGT